MFPIGKYVTDVMILSHSTALIQDKKMGCIDVLSVGNDIVVARRVQHSRWTLSTSDGVVIRSVVMFVRLLID